MEIILEFVFVQHGRAISLESVSFQHKKKATLMGGPETIQTLPHFMDNA